jgi:hypothetical protein
MQCSPHREHSVSTGKADRLMVYRKVIGTLCKSRRDIKHTLWIKFRVWVLILAARTPDRRL